MKLETDLKTIKRLAEEREDENWRFRTFLKQCDNKEIDAIVHRLLEGIAPQIDCSTCRNCCMELHPECDEAEIERLTGLLELSKEEFKERYMVERGEGTFYIQGPPCPFLREMRCTIEAARPQGCRDYPYLHKEDFTFRLMAVVSNCAICPIVFNVYERLKKEVWHRRTQRR